MKTLLYFLLLSFLLLDTSNFIVSTRPCSPKPKPRGSGSEPGGFFGSGEGGIGVPGLGNGSGNGGNIGSGYGYGYGYAGPSGGYSKGGVVRPSVVCKEKGPCFKKKVTCPAKCFTSYSRSGKNFGAGGGGGGCTIDCEIKCIAYC